ncbi:leucine-rich repeat, cysteine-containing subtype protein [Tanacetum coccineum]
MSYLQDNDDLNSVSLVSKNLFDIDYKTRKHLTVHVHFAPDPKRVSHRFPNIESLTLKSYSYGLKTLNISSRNLSNFREVFKRAKKLDHFGYGAIDEDQDYSGFRFPPNIRGLRIEDLTEASFPFLRPYLNQLRELELKCARIRSNCLCYFLESCPSLEVLQTDDICKDKGLKVIGQFCKKLRKLTHLGRVTQKGLIAVAQGCPNLEYLEVHILDISNKALECVGTCLKNLRDFRVILSVKGGKTDFPLDNGVRAMLMGCKNLERLDIDLCPGALTNVGLGYVGEYGHNLRHLSLSNTAKTDVGLLELLKGCPKLRKLKLKGRLFSKQAITTSVFSINQSLRYVWLDFGSFDVSVLTRPMVSAQVLTKLYLKLAGILRRLALQLVADGSDAGSIKITYTSSRVTDDIDTPFNPQYVLSEFGDIKLQGRVKDGVPHLTKVGAFEVDVSLDGHILLCRQVDEPNTIVSVASILGKENVNISTMSVYRAAPRKQAVMVIAVDEKPSEEAMKKIDEILAVEEFVFLAL